MDSRRNRVGAPRRGSPTQGLLRSSGIAIRVAAKKPMGLAAEPLQQVVSIALTFANIGRPQWFAPRGKTTGGHLVLKGRASHQAPGLSPQLKC